MIYYIARVSNFAKKKEKQEVQSHLCKYTHVHLHRKKGYIHSEIFLLAFITEF